MFQVMRIDNGSIVYPHYTESNILGLKCRYYTASLKAFLYLPICCQSGALLQKKAGCRDSQWIIMTA